MADWNVVGFVSSTMISKLVKRRLEVGGLISIHAILAMPPILSAFGLKFGRKKERLHGVVQLAFLSSGYRQRFKKAKNLFLFKISKSKNLTNVQISSHAFRKQGINKVNYDYNSKPLFFQHLGNIFEDFIPKSLNLVPPHKLHNIL